MKDHLSAIQKFKPWKAGQLKFLFQDENFAKNFYAFEAVKLLRSYTDNKNIISNELQNTPSSPHAKKRMKALVQSFDEQAECLNHILKFLNYSTISIEEFHSYLQHRPGPSALMPNYDNIFRDWAWGKEEQDLFIQFVLSNLSGDESFSKLLALGSGAGRLCADLILEKKPSWSALVDFNPLLVKVSEQLMTGQTVSLFESPTAPLDDDHQFIKRSMKSGNPLKSGVDFLVADVRTLFLKKDSFDCVFTPWLIDALDMHLVDFFKVLNHHLKAGGHWICVGPLQFAKRKVSHQYKVPEIIELAHNSGFELVKTAQTEAPYMKSPDSGSYRMERIHFFSFKKLEDVEAVEFNPIWLEPEWIQNPDIKIKLPIQPLNLVRGHEFNAKVLKMVDGNRSLNEIAKEFEAKMKASPEQVQYLIAQIIKNSVLYGK